MTEWFNSLPAGQQFALFSLLKIVIAVFAVVLPMVAYSVVAERRISACIRTASVQTALAHGACFNRRQTA